MNIKEIVVKLRIGLSSFSIIFLLFFLAFPFNIYADDLTVSGKVPLLPEYENLIMNNSRIVAVPVSALINNTILVTVTVSDGAYVLPGQTIVLGVIGVNGVSLKQLNNVTDTNGQIVAQVTSTVPGTFQLYAIDQTYKQDQGIEFLLAQSPMITFSVNPIIKVENKINPPIVSATPTLIPTTSLTLTPTTTPFVTSMPIPFTTAQPTILQRIFNFSVCSPNENPVFGLVLILLFVVFAFVWKFATSKEQVLLYSLIYLIIVIIAIIALKIFCTPLIVTLFIWAILTGVSMKPLRESFIHHEIL